MIVVAVEYFSGAGTQLVVSRDGGLTPNNLNLRISIGTVTVSVT